MAISFVGSASDGNLNGGDASIDVSGLGLQENDIIIGIGGIGGTAAGSQNLVGDNSGQFTTLETNDSVNLQFGAWWQRVGTTPDDTLTGSGNGDSGDSCAYAVMVFRGASLFSDPFEGSSAVSVNSGSADPNPGSKTFTAPGVAIICGFLSEVSDNTVTAPSGYATVESINANDQEDATVGISHLLTPTSPEDPGVFLCSSGRWRCNTMALLAAPTVFDQVVEAHSDPMQSGMRDVEMIGY